MTPGFSTLHIAVTALITAALSIPVAIALLCAAPKPGAAAATVVSGLTTFGWRLAANVDALNGTVALRSAIRP